MEDLLQATDNKHLMLEDQFEGEANSARPPLHSEQQHDFWDNRYLCIQGIHDDKFWRFDIFDLLTSESKPVRFRKFSNQFQDVETYFLSYKFMFIVEIGYHFESHCVNLVQLNWESREFEKLEHFEREDFSLSILVDPLNQSKFVLQFSDLDDDLPTEYQECKFVGGKIEFGDVHQSPVIAFLYSNGKLIGIDDLDRKLRIKIYNMAGNQEQTFETETFPEHVELMGYFSRNWIVDRLYVAICFRDSDNYGLMWADAQTRRWNILDFSTTMEIQDLHFFKDTLIVRTYQAQTENGTFNSSVKVYEIAIHRPQSLRQKAWLRVIRNLKADNHPNPYKEARRYLPLNTDLRPYWFEDVEEEASDKQDSEKDNTEAIQEASLDQNGDKDVEDAAPDEQGNEESNSTITIEDSETSQETSLDQDDDKGVKDEAPDEQGNDGEE